MRVLATDDPMEALNVARPFLQTDPVRHNLILTLLTARADRPEPGRYWIADPAEPCALVFQSPLNFKATITPMPDMAADALVDAIAGAGIRLPGVGGDAAAAARFAGAWTERTKSAATPLRGERIYEVAEVIRPFAVTGILRQAEAADRSLLIEWMRGFVADTGESLDPMEMVDRRLPSGDFWIWTDDQPVSVAAISIPVAGVARVQCVYTPPALRGRGYAGACVADLSAATIAHGYRPILYTDLGNPTSNGVYRRIGYRAVAEGIVYRFD